MSESTPQWNEEASQAFIDNGRYSVPSPKIQMQNCVVIFGGRKPTVL